MDLMEIAVDPRRELEGAEVYPWNDKTMLLVARYNNAPFRALQNKLMNPLVQAAGKEGISVEQAAVVLGKCMAKTILLGWSGLFIDGKEVEYTPNKCQEILLDPRFIDFKEAVMREAQDLDHYRLQSLEDDLGNLPGSSATEQTGRSSSKSSSKQSRKKKAQGGRRQRTVRS